LTDNERRLLDHLLRGEGPGLSTLREQIASVQVTGPWSPGSASLRLSVAAGAPAADLLDGPLPTIAWAYDAEGRPTGSLMVYVENGYLSDIEYGWVTDDPPTELPSADAIRPAK